MLQVEKAKRRGENNFEWRGCSYRIINNNTQIDNLANDKHSQEEVNTLVNFREFTDESSIPDSIGYTSDPCERCGRVRVELLTDGDLVCEKCYWSQVNHLCRYDIREYW
ncbi:hypothetical protein [Marinilactibacillus sp. 15R]|uniref:hypothetical protein n=1 Tax=Marinilactibacillus sp. 15R TaxID=1911586 RepID=UPI0012EB247A|nr:hypothetical protein [Marinilactibacillus sp. 15R]